MASDWYKERLTTFQARETERLTKGLEYLEHFTKGPDAIKGDWKGQQIVEDLKLHDRIEAVKSKIAAVKKPEYVDHIKGSLGVDPVLYSVTGNNYERKLPNVLNQL